MNTTKTTNPNPEHDPAKCITLQECLDGIWQRVKDNGDIPDGLEIDYASWGGTSAQTPTGEKPTDYRLTSYEFNVRPIVDYGGSEGIYLDVDFTGKWDIQKGDGCRMHVATIKTLQDDKAAMRKMGELCGLIVYHATQFINERIDEFDGSGKTYIRQ